jgi:thiamine biosynthesis lipoprotein
LRPRPFIGLSNWQLARRIVAPALFVGALFYAVLSHEPAPIPTLEDLALDEVTLSGEALGTSWSVRVIGPAPDEAGQQALAEAITSALEEVDEKMSTWREDSELTALNQHASTEPFPVAASTMAVLMRAESVWRETDGAFDVTVYPLVRAWGFGGAEQTSSPPTDADIADLLQRVGQQHLTLNHELRHVTKTRPDITIDLSAIAKGYAVDRISVALTGQGHAHHMVEVGGEIRARGWNRFKQPWRLAVERPDTMARTVEAVVQLSNLSMATSGDYRSFREHDGRRWSHTIDPRTGTAQLHTLASATVLHAECAFADAYATAFMVMGPDAAMTLATQRDIAALFLIRLSDGGFEHRSSPAFEQHQRAARDLPGVPDVVPPAG